MKRTIILILIALFLLESSGLKEIIKIPFLVQHYFEHTQSYPGDTFLDYLFKHYKTEKDSKTDPDNNTDKQLPFKSTDCFQAHISAFILSEFSITPVVFDIVSEDYATYVELKISSCSFDIWQPPQTA